VTRPSSRVSLAIGGVLVLGLAGSLIARSWHANLLERIRAKPTIAIVNDAGQEVRDVNLFLSGSDFVTKEYQIAVLEPGREITVTVDARQEFMMKRLTFFVEENQYEAVDGPSMGPGECGTIVIRHDMQVLWQFSDGVAMVMRQAGSDD
jgi:hypothetical protein